jgi:hypothetical protein
MNCPNCGQSAASHTARCGHCNFKLPENTRPHAAEPLSARPCWNCEHPNPAHAERCECCNAKQHAVVVRNLGTIRLPLGEVPAKVSGF